MSRLVRLLAAAGAIGALAAIPTLASASASPGHAGIDVNGRHLLGWVPGHHGSRLAHNFASFGSFGNLRYHTGGTGMKTTAAIKVYTIFWQGSNQGSGFAPGYAQVMDQYLADVGAASGASGNGTTSNVFYSDTQYYDYTGSGGTKRNFKYWISPSVTSITDTTPIPKNCTDSATPAGCVTDSSLAQEAYKDAVANHWQLGTNSEVFVFTPKGYGSDMGGYYAFTDYCAYHSSYQASSTAPALIYANMPYANTNTSACGTGQSPNGNEADGTINVTSHEFNESITDWAGNAWYDWQGNENGDKCAWNFGTASGTKGAEYNQTINGHRYYTQQEWSNAHSKCVLTGT